MYRQNFLRLEADVIIFIGYQILEDPEIPTNTVFGEIQIDLLNINTYIFIFIFYGRQNNAINNRTFKNFHGTSRMRFAYAIKSNSRCYRLICFILIENARILNKPRI